MQTFFLIELGRVKTPISLFFICIPFERFHFTLVLKTQQKVRGSFCTLWEIPQVFTGIHVPIGNIFFR